MKAAWQRLLENLSRMLNSNENFQMDDTFHLSFVHVRAGPYGGGKKRKYLPGHQSSTRLKVVKKTVIAIPQTDEPISAVLEPLSPPGPMCKITLSGEPS